MRRTVIERWVLAFVIVGMVLAGLDTVWNIARPNPTEGNYRKASERIHEHNGHNYTFGVMDRHHGVYVSLQHSESLFPSDSPDRVFAYARYAHVKYVFCGPEERMLNPRLFAEANFLQEVAEFGNGPREVDLFEVVPNSGVAKAAFVKSAACK